MSTLAHAIAIAAAAHEQQQDKVGAPYILHPLRMMFRLSDPDAQIVAVLHDMVEDCPGWTLDRLRSHGFSQSVVAAVDAMTRREADGETYEAFVLRAAGNPLARRVKVADLEDNSDLSRIATPSEKDHRRIEKYQKALATIRKMQVENDR